MTTVVRVPDRMAEEARQIAALKGVTVGAVIAEAWELYITNHAERFAGDAEAFLAELHSKAAAL